MEKSMFIVKPIHLEHAPGFREALDAVARERIHLGQTEARSLEWAQDFVATNINNNHAQFVALNGNEVIGWCDIIPFARLGFRHTGGLGIGVVKSWRGKGVGKALLAEAVGKAVKNGITRIELEVYASNTAAIELYRKNGFVDEGIKRRARFLDEKYEDILMMALLIGMH